MTSLTIEIWSDIACPWCYVGKRRFEAALREFPHNDSVQILWRAFELDPAAPRVRPAGASYAERLAAKYRCSLPDAELMIRRMTDTAAADGLDFHFERIRPGNTFDAHRLLHLAREHGRAGELKEQLFYGYLTAGEAIGDPAALTRMAIAAGLDAAAVHATLLGDAFADGVRADEAAAQAAGIGGVPFFVIGRHRLSGAQPPQVLRAALDDAWPTPPGDSAATRVP